MLACYFLIQTVLSGVGCSLTPTPSPSPLFTPWRPTQGPVPFVQPDTDHAPLGTFVPCPWVCFMHGLELTGCPVLLPSLTLLSWRAFPTLPAEVTFRWVTHNIRGGGLGVCPGRGPVTRCLQNTWRALGNTTFLLEL